MKITKTEKIWLAAVLIFYIAYNLPFVPAYGDAKGAIIHGVLTLIPLWVAIYVGLVKVCRIYKLKDTENIDTENAADNIAEENGAVRQSVGEKEETKIC